MKRTLASLLLLLPACWADFPEHLIEPDNQVVVDQGMLETATDLPTEGVITDGPLTDGPALVDGPVTDGLGLDGDGPIADLLPDGSDVDGQPDTGPVGPLKGLGVGCAADAECYTGHCVDNVCCNTPCGAACMKCDQANKLGRCEPIPDNQDPDNDCTPQPSHGCGLDGFCDGRGACRKWAGGTVCAQPACTGSSNDKVVLARVCDGNGTCLNLGEVDCKNYRCNQATKSCYSTCSNSMQCVQGVNCASGKCGGEKKPNGSSCGSFAECESNLCTDNVCCDSQCPGTCKTCKLTIPTTTSSITIAGKCINVPPGLDPGGECSPTAKHTCDNDGTCDGAGACRNYVSGTVCQMRQCNITTNPDQLEPFHRCDGSGTCQSVGIPTSCGAFNCLSGFACYGQCTSNTHCTPPNTCNLTTKQCQ